MTLGEGIFYSSLFAGVITLYIATRDRWRWKRILLWPAGLVVLTIIGVGVFEYVQSLPTVQTEFWGITLQDSKADVLFKKGKADWEESEDFWWYSYGSTEAPPIGTYIIRFDGNNIRSIGHVGFDRTHGVQIQGIRPSDSMSSVEEQYGKTTEIISSPDETKRMLEYSAYNVFFGFDTNQINALGVYNSERGGVGWRNWGDDKDTAASGNGDAIPYQ